MEQRGAVRRTFCAVFLVAALMPLASFADDPAATRAQLREAMNWLVPQWDDAREQALQAKEAAASGPGYYTEPLHVPGSQRSYTRKQINAVPPDWWPQDHPPMPAIVAVGQDKAIACAACHQPDGAGTASTAALAGLAQTYLMEQMAAFRSGGRASPEMHAEALAVSDADLHAAAAYFAGLHLSAPRARVVEAAQVPVTQVETWMLVPAPGGRTEAIGERIIEIPEDVEQARLFDAHARYVAYVPPGSIERGKHLAATGDGSIPACSGCHGADLRGSKLAPPLAGRSPTALSRQLVEFASGQRKGASAAPMQAVVAHLNLSDMIAAAAYAASLPP